MSNPHRGGVTLQAGDRIYTLSFSVNAICELEDHFGDKPIGEILAGFDDPKAVSMKKARALVWAGLRDHHKDVTLEEAGNIASEAGVETTMKAIGKAMQLASPEPAAGEAGKARARPQIAVNG